MAHRPHLKPGLSRVNLKVNCDLEGRKTACRKLGMVPAGGDHRADMAGGRARPRGQEGHPSPGARTLTLASSSGDYGWASIRDQK